MNTDPEKVLKFGLALINHLKVHTRVGHEFYVKMLFQWKMWFPQNQSFWWDNFDFAEIFKLSIRKIKTKYFISCKVVPNCSILICQTKLKCFTSCQSDINLCPSELPWCLMGVVLWVHHGLIFLHGLVSLAELHLPWCHTVSPLMNHHGASWKSCDHSAARKMKSGQEAQSIEENGGLRHLNYIFTEAAKQLKWTQFNVKLSQRETFQSGLTAMFWSRNVKINTSRFPNFNFIELSTPWKILIFQPFGWI